MKAKSFTIKAKTPKARKKATPPTKVMKSKKDYTRKNKLDNVEDSVNIRSMLSKFVTNIFEKKYSDANNILASVVTEKLKTKIKNVTTKNEKCNCDCNNCKKNKKKVLTSN